MTAAIYDYTVHASPAGGKDALAKLRTFLISKGWVSEDYRTSCAWVSDGGSGYEWGSGDDDFCQMYSNGYGHQPIRVRFLVLYDALNTNHVKFHHSVIDPTNSGTPDGASAIHPQYQNEWSLPYARYLSVPSGTFNELYLFGNNKWCLVGFRCTATTFITINFGTPELYPEYRNTTELQMRWPGQYHYTSDYTWDEIDQGNYTGYFYPPWTHRASSNFDFMWYDGEPCNYLQALPNLGNVNGTEYEYWNNFDEVRKVNSWSGKRLMLRIDLFVKNSSDVWEPVGHHPCRALPVSGLSLAEVISYGNDDYMTFPFPAFGSVNGFAIKV